MPWWAHGRILHSGEDDESIHVKGWSFPLDGRETHHAVLEGHFGPEALEARMLV
jgi:hypothetical protein